MVFAHDHSSPRYTEGPGLDHDDAMDRVAWTLFWRYFAISTVMIVISNVVVVFLLELVWSILTGQGIRLVFWLGLDLSVVAVAQAIVAAIVSFTVFRIVLGARIGKVVGNSTLVLQRVTPPAARSPLNR